MITHVPAPARSLRRVGALILLACIAAALAWLPLRTAAAAAALVATTLLLLWRPWLVWVAIGAALPFAAGVKLAGPLSLLDIALAAAFGLWFIDGARRHRLRLDATGPALAALVYALLLFVSALGAADLPQAAAEVVKWLEFAAVLALVPQMARGPQQARWVASALIAGASAQALLGVYQFVFRIGPEWFVILGRFMRASGTFSQPNPYAGFLGLVLPVALSLAIKACADLLRTPARGRLWLWAIGFTAATVLITAALLASWSRGGWLGAVAGVGVVIVARSRRAAILAGVALLLLALAVLLGSLTPAQAPQPIAARLQEIPAFFGAGDPLHQEVNDDNFALVERLAHWKAAERMFAAAPVLGVGPGNYAAAYDTYRLPGWTEPLGHAHNIYLNVLAESGIIGFAGFVVLWSVSLVFVLRRRAAHYGPFTRALAVGVLGVLAHLAVHSLVDNLFVQGIYGVVALWLALVDVSAQDDNGSSNQVAATDLL